MELLQVADAVAREKNLFKKLAALNMVTITTSVQRLIVNQVPSH